MNHVDNFYPTRHTSPFISSNRYSVLETECQKQESTYFATDCTKKKLESNNNDGNDPKNDEFWSNYKVLPVPADGFCFIYACCISLSEQRSICTSKNVLLDMLRNECISNRNMYVQFLVDDVQPFFDFYVHVYTAYGMYNTPFGDIVPTLMANALNCDFHIIESFLDRHETRIIHPFSASEPSYTLFLYKNGDHYEAISPIISNLGTLFPDAASKQNKPMTNTQTSFSKPMFTNVQIENISISSKHKSRPNDTPSILHCKKKNSYTRSHSLKSVHKAFVDQTKRDSGLRICHLNIRSIYNKIDEIRFIVTASEIDVFCLSESWLDDSIQDSEINIPGYAIERRDRNRTGGGVVMYIKDSIRYKPRPDIESASRIVENVWIEIESSNEGAKSYLICCMYRPPSSRVQYFNGILDIIEKAASDDKEIVLLGDLNYDYRFDESLSTNPLHYIENLFGLNQLIKEYTRVSKSTSSLLDIILCSNNKAHTKQCVFKFTLSDHYMIYTCVKDLHISNVHKSIQFRSYKNFDPDFFLRNVSECFAFREIRNGSIKCTESAWKLWKQSFNDICDVHAPLRKMRVRNKHSPWITHDIVKLMYERDFAHRKAKSNGSNTVLWDDYRRLRNLVTNKILQSKNSYLADITPKIKTDSKTMWKELGRVVGNKKRDNPTPVQ